MTLELLIFFFSFVLGTIIGSFLNCVIYRLSKKESFLKGKSYCPHCKHQLNWQDLMPLVSFLLLKGRCRYCQKKISFQYPLVEIATGFIFFLIVFQNMELILLGSLLLAFLKISFLFLISSFLIIIFVYDLFHFIIPDKVIFPAIFLVGVWQIISTLFFNFQNKYYLLNNLYSAFGAGLFFLLIVLLSRGKGMGVGDVKLAFFMGLLLGFPDILVALFSSFFLGALVGVFLIISSKRTLKSEVPFAPFLVTGTFLSLFWGSEIIDFYLHLVLL